MDPGASPPATKKPLDPFAELIVGDALESARAKGLDLETADGVEQAMVDAVEQSQPETAPVVSDDVADAMASEDITFLVPTGNYRENRPVQLKVVCRDPKDPALATKYLLAMKRNPAGAIRALWKSCIVSPRSICDDDDVYTGLSTAFKTALGVRLLGIIGLTEDFFGASKTPSATSGRPAKKSSPTSPKPGASLLPESAPSSPPATSSSPTSDSPSSDYVDVPMASPTPTTPSPGPSTARPHAASRTLSTRTSPLAGGARSA